MLVQQKRSPVLRWHDTQKLRTNTWNLWTHYENYRIRKLDVPCGGKKCQLLFRESISKAKKLRNISLVLFATKTPKKKHQPPSQQISISSNPPELFEQVFLVDDVDGFPRASEKYAQLSNWIISPNIGVKFQKVLEVSPPTGFFSAIRAQVVHPWVPLLYSIPGIFLPKLCVQIAAVSIQPTKITYQKN